MNANPRDATLPELQLADWRPTKDTLHLYAQILGKIRLATTPPRNHWWNAALYVDVRGLTTRRLHHQGTTFEINIDFVDHALVVETADGRTRSFELGGGVAVADFDARLHSALRALGVDVEIKEQPFGVPMTTPFTRDVEHASWDRDAIERFGRVLDWSDTVFEEFSGWFNGKTSPVHLFWHSLDLAVTRFSGRPGAPIDADRVTREAYSQELISFGFWAGDDTFGDAAYYSYTAPEPAGLRDATATRRRMDRVRRRLTRRPPVRDRPQGAGLANDAARVLPSSVRGRGPTRRVGHHQLRVELVPHSAPATTTPSERRRRFWSTRRVTLSP